MGPDRMDEIQDALRDVLGGAGGTRNGSQKSRGQVDAVPDLRSLAAPALVAQEMLHIKLLLM